mgnify:CR=1 FL=1
MAWTTPKTWASGYVVLAADLNTHLRDNLNVTAPAVMTTQGDIIIASGANTPIRLAKSTTSTQYLANTGTSNAPAWDEVALATGVSGVLPVANGGVGVALSAPGADRILFWDHTATAYAYLTAGTNLTISGTTITAASAPTEATQSDMEDEGTTNADRMVSPEVTRYAPGVAKAYCQITNAAGAPATGSYNIASGAKNGTGDYTMTYTSSFSTSTYTAIAGIVAGDSRMATTTNLATGTCDVFTFISNAANTKTISDAMFVALGDQ